MGQKTKILIVDDIFANIELLKAILLLHDFEIITASTGKEALDLTDRESPDLILLDISLPDIDGYLVCKTLKASPITSDIPIVFLSALNEIDNLIEGFNSGGQDFITKPYNSEELIVRIGTHLELRQRKKQVEEYAISLYEANHKLKELNSLLNEQNQIIESRNKDLKSSIDYAKIIQDSILPNTDLLTTTFQEHFLIYRPKDILSGDFYYFASINNKSIIVVGDCTGHGVPGALLSVFTITLLTEIILHRKIDDPESILKSLDQEFVNRFAINTSNSGDGMDIVLLMIDQKNALAEFIGCKRPIIFLRENNLEYIRGLQNSIGGIHHKEKEFKSTILKTRLGDTFYLFSDGITDQFDFHDKEKFGAKNLRNLLMRNQRFSLEQQAELLNKEINDWQGDNEQIDDMIILGLKI